MERLQKVIANSGYCSRRKAEELIQKGKVIVNDIKVTELGFKVNGSDKISIDGKMLSRDEKEYYLLYKPRGIITSTKDEKNRKTVVDLIETDKRIYPVGRLDYDTSGIILLTNDGELTNLLIHPRNKIDKIYVAKIKGILTKEETLKLTHGVVIDNKKTSPSKVKIKKIDKMFEAVGHDVLKLKREKFDFLNLEGLKSGEYRKLNIKEVKKLYNDANKNSE